tara:strand:- start:1312 stop:1698 length:387 start_codon:yes stop_codon:yes gene_type:complete
MDNTTQLFIRACRTSNDIQRLQSVYRRFYGDYGDKVNMVAIGDLLTHIVDEYTTMSIGEYKRKQSEYHSYDQVANMMRKKGEEEKHTEEYLLHLYVMHDKIRYTNKDKLIEVGMRTPAMFRNKIKENK